LSFTKGILFLNLNGIRSGHFGFGSLFFFLLLCMVVCENINNKLSKVSVNGKTFSAVSFGVFLALHLQPNVDLRFEALVLDGEINHGEVYHL
jgi:hypothetical protein